MDERVKEWAKAQSEVAAKWRTQCNAKMQKGSTVHETDEYVLVEIQHTTEQRTQKKMAVAELGRAQMYFAYTHFNRMQSEAAEKAYKSRDNMYVSAPTGSGKTEIAILAIIKEYAEKKGRMRVVYIAPIKALVKEIETKIRSRLPFAACIADTTDSKVTEYSKYSVVVTTPEKCDVLTMRKKYVPTLLIIDEIQVISEDRGSVLESIVIRMRKNACTRIVAISGTVPNYMDIGQFIGATPSNTMYFGPGYREVPMTLQVYGINSTEAHSKDRVVQSIVAHSIDGCTLVFVKSKEETHTVAQQIATEIKKETKRETKDAMDKDAMEKSAMKDSTVHTEGRYKWTEYAKRYGSVYINAGVCVHHSGLTQEIRSTVEMLYRAGKLKVLVCTSTLAWGVNLPANTVIVHGTKTYRKDRGTVEYTVNEIAQMCGRAGRKGTAKHGKAVVITDKENVTAYAHALTVQYPAESMLMSHIETRIVYEIAGSTNTVQKLTEWLQSSYAYIRSKKHTELYDIADKPEHIVRCVLHNLAHKKMMHTHNDSNTLMLTALGTICYKNYVDVETISTYAQILDKINDSKVQIDAGDAIRIMSTATDFAEHSVHAHHEEDELAETESKVPYPVKPVHAKVASIIDSIRKGNKNVCIVMQAYISKMQMSHGIASMAEHISHSTPRLCHALFALSLAQMHTSVHCMLYLYKAIQHRAWNVCTNYTTYSGTIEIDSKALCTHSTIDVIITNTLRIHSLISVSSMTQHLLVYAKVTSDQHTVITLPAHKYPAYKIQVDDMHRLCTPLLYYL